MRNCGKLDGYQKFFNLPCHWSVPIPLKTSKNKSFPDVFNGYRKKPTKETNRLKEKKLTHEL